MNEPNVEELHKKCDIVNSTLRESIENLNLTDMRPGDVIDYNTSFRISDWNKLKHSQCFDVSIDSSGERLTMSKECLACQEVLRPTEK